MGGRACSPGVAVRLGRCPARRSDAGRTPIFKLPDEVTVNHRTVLARCRQALLAAAAVAVGGGAGCRPRVATEGAAAIAQPSTARPAVIGADEGERRFLRGGTAPLLIKIDPVNTGSQRMVLGSSDLPPGDMIPSHRHLREDEIIIILQGKARVILGTQAYTATTGGTVFIPQGTCITVANIGADTLRTTFIFSSPGFEQVLREVSTRPGEPPRVVSPSERAAVFHRGHADASPGDC